MSEKEYKPIPVSAAADLARQYDKQMVVVIAYDMVHMQVQTTTFGSEEKYQEFAKVLGEVFTNLAGGDVLKAKVFEDLTSRKQT